MENQPLASIGVPVNNAGAQLETCLNSIMALAYEDWGLSFIGACPSTIVNYRKHFKPSR